MVHFNRNQKWYWLPGQKDDEVLVFKAYDSDNKGSWRKSSLGLYKIYVLTPYDIISMSSWRIFPGRT